MFNAQPTSEGAGRGVEGGGGGGGGGGQKRESTNHMSHPRIYSRWLVLESSASDADITQSQEQKNTI